MCTTEYVCSPTLQMAARLRHAFDVPASSNISLLELKYHLFLDFAIAAVLHVNWCLESLSMWYSSANVSRTPAMALVFLPPVKISSHAVDYTRM
jgi:hypothetical protein